MLFLKSLQYPLETLRWSLFLKKLQAWMLEGQQPFKKRSQYRCCPVSMAKFLRLPILKNICEMLLFYFFNGSLLHWPDGSRLRLYDGVRLQHPNHRPSFLTLSRHLSFWTVSRPAFENLGQIPLMSQLNFYIGYFWSF